MTYPSSEEPAPHFLPVLDENAGQKVKRCWQFWHDPDRVAALNTWTCSAGTLRLIGSSSIFSGVTLVFVVTVLVTKLRGRAKAVVVCGRRVFVQLGREAESAAGVGRWRVRSSVAAVDWIWGRGEAAGAGSAHNV